jgi:hypothetical protein
METASDHKTEGQFHFHPHACSWNVEIPALIDFFKAAFSKRFEVIKISITFQQKPEFFLAGKMKMFVPTREFSILSSFSFFCVRERELRQFSRLKDRAAKNRIPALLSS